MHGTQQHDARPLHRLKTLSRASLASLGIAIVIAASLNLVVHGGTIHGPWAWTGVVLANICLMGFALLSLSVMFYATYLAQQGMLMDGKRALLWTWGFPFFGAPFYFACSNR